ncbi:MAG: hypothetical protein JRJ54_12220 [Deltaproteobacteria bacterium]|nr:hypothetical protein [Deltaproteobacteria bacterium]
MRYSALCATAPLLMIGMVAFIVEIPTRFTDPATALPVQIYLWADSPEQAFVERTSAAVIVLLAFLIVMNAAAVILRRRFERRMNERFQGYRLVHRTSERGENGVKSKKWKGFDGGQCGQRLDTMKKILYGVQTTGNGHVCRSREVIACLKAMGHEVHVLFSGKDPRRFANLEVFHPNQSVDGLTFRTQKGRVHVFSTLLSLNLFRFYRDAARLDAAGYDLIITDFEPFTARLARRYQIPSIGIGHQYAFYYDIPMGDRCRPYLWILKRFAFCDTPIGLHWYHFNCPIMPPIVPEGLKRAPKKTMEKILVYLPFEDPETVKGLLSAFDNHRFYIYGMSGVDAAENVQNLCVRPFSRTGFLEDLSECGGVLSNAGFELISEALHIGKKILVKPLKGQMEQESNALALVRLKLGEAMASLDRRCIRKWLDAPHPPAMGYPRTAQIIAQWIHEGRRKEVRQLAEEAWRRTAGIEYLSGFG